MTFAYANEDRLPNDRAVWRECDGMSPMGEPGDRQVTVDYGGVLQATYVGQARWQQVKRWRWGWAPRG